MHLFCRKVMIRKLNKIVWSISLIGVFAILVNDAVFVHTHILPDGRVIEHAHPYHSTSSSSDPQPNHHHTSQEFLLLSYIYHFFSSAYPLLIVILFFNGILCNYFSIELKTSFSDCCKNVQSSRAPPVFSIAL